MTAHSQLVHRYFRLTMSLGPVLRFAMVPDAILMGVRTAGVGPGLTDRLPQLGSRAACARQAIRDDLLDHKSCIAEHGEEHPFALGWKWGEKVPVARRSSTEGDNV